MFDDFLSLNSSYKSIKNPIINFNSRTSTFLSNSAKKRNFSHWIFNKLKFCISSFHQKAGKTTNFIFIESTFVLKRKKAHTDACLEMLSTLLMGFLPHICFLKEIKREKKYFAAWMSILWVKFERKLLGLWKCFEKTMKNGRFEVV